MILPLSEKSKNAIRLGHKEPIENTVYEGSIRSAKTFTSLIEWADYVLHCKMEKFLMSGNTLGSLSRNCIDDPEFGFIAISKGTAQERTDRDGSHYIQMGSKKIYLMGANDVGSYKKLQGLTIGGWYADELSLHNPMFIKTALGRSISSPLVRNIATLNPEAPNHWIYTDPDIGLDRWGSNYVPKYFRLWHFTLNDNPAITEERKRRLAESYSGIFYQRYILGLRVMAEGRIYGSFVNNKRGEEGNVLDIEPGTNNPKEKIFKVTFGLDFGGNKSATAIVCVGWFVRDNKLCIVILDEVFDSKNHSVESMISQWKSFISRIREKYLIDRAFGDSSEQLIIKSLNNLGLPVYVEDAMKRPIIDRIRLFDALFAQRRAFIMRKCKHTIEAFDTAMWDPKKIDERLDDGTTNIDSLDAVEYAVEREMSALIEDMR